MVLTKLFIGTRRTSNPLTNRLFRETQSTPTNVLEVPEHKPEIASSSPPEHSEISPYLKLVVGTATFEIPNKDQFGRYAGQNIFVLYRHNPKKGGYDVLEERRDRDSNPSQLPPEVVSYISDKIVQLNEFRRRAQ